MLHSNVFALFLILAATAVAEVNPCPRACLASGNFTVDSYGPPDTRPGTEGHADFMIFPLKFTPPPGYRVRILRLRGDLVSWPVTKPGQSVPVGAHAGVLLGFSTTAPDTSVRCDWCADNTMMYIQDALTDRPVRTPYDTTVEEGGLLEPDHKLLVRVAQWMNTTGFAIHLEPTFTVSFRFESASDVPASQSTSR